jgi:hypothetical protein
MNRIISPIRLLVLLSVLAFSAFSQTAQVTGRVTDTSGAVVPGAKVAATNIETGVARESVSNDAGNYLIMGLLPGRYRVTAEAAGFKLMRREPVILEVDQVGRIDFSMEVGEVRESVSVEASAVLLDSATSTIGTLVENKQIVELPLNGRDPIDLLSLSPGIRTQSGFGGRQAVGGTNPSGTWSNFSFSGGLAGSNVIMVEGLALDLAQMNWPSYVPPVEATQEFRVQTNKFSAEYGRTSGAVVNFSIKSGTNQLHGNLLDFWRNTVLNANNFFQNRSGVARAPFNQHQFGGSVGGPIKRDKTFFFVNVEEFRQATASRGLGTVPTALQHNGDFSQTYTSAGRMVVIADALTTRRQPDGTYIRDPFANNVIPPERISRVAANVTKIYPQPTLPGTQFTNVNNYTTTGGTSTSEHQVVGKLDYNMNTRWKIFGTYARQWADLSTIPPFEYTVNLARANMSERNHATLSATAVFNPGLVGEFHTGYARLVQNSVPYALGFDITTLGFPKSLADQAQIQSFPNFTISGITAVSSGSSGMSLTTCNSWGQRGSLTWVTGSHSLKFGGDYRVQQLNQFQANALLPNFQFTNQMSALNPLKLDANSGVPMASFLLGYTASASVAKSQRMANQRKFLAVFIQDDWKVSGKLTVNVGVDYSLEFPITERYNRKMWFEPAIELPISQTVGMPIHGGFEFADEETRSPYDLYKGQWGPRVGFAYQLLPQTVVRSGYGLFWIPAAINEITGDSRAPAWALSTQMMASLDGGLTPFDKLDNPYPLGIIDPPGNTQGANTLLGLIAAANRRHYRAGYMQQWNFDIQQELGREMILDAAYAGSSGTGLPTGYATNANQVPDQYLSLGSALLQQVPNPFYPLVQSGLIKSGVLSQPQILRSQLLRPYPQFDTVFNEGDPVGHSSYHAFMLQFKRRFGGSLLSAAYTISKAIGDTENRLDTGNGAGYANIYNRRQNRSIALYDSPQRLVFSYNYELPFGKGQRFLAGSGPVSWVVSGWQLSGVYTAQSGTPLGLRCATNLTANYSENTDVYGTYNSNAFPNNNGRSAKLTGPVVDRLTRYFDTSTFSQPPAYTYGNTARTLPDVRSHWMNNIDASVSRNFRFGAEGRFNVQFRAEAFNLANRVRFGTPGLVYGQTSFGVISSAGSPRAIQLALKFLF